MLTFSEAIKRAAIHNTGTILQSQFKFMTNAIDTFDSRFFSVKQSIWILYVLYFMAFRQRCAITLKIMVDCVRDWRYSSGDGFIFAVSGRQVPDC